MLGFSPAALSTNCPDTSCDVGCALVICEECHKVADTTARGWRAYFMDGLTPYADKIVFYCPGCALAEFGPPRRHTDDRE